VNRETEILMKAMMAPVEPDPNLGDHPIPTGEQIAQRYEHLTHVGKMIGEALGVIKLALHHLPDEVNKTQAEIRLIEAEVWATRALGKQVNDLLTIHNAQQAATSAADLPAAPETPFVVTES
jgi:hypothetical protein